MFRKTFIKRALIAEDIGVQWLGKVIRFTRRSIIIDLYETGPVRGDVELHLSTRLSYEAAARLLGIGDDVW